MNAREQLILGAPPRISQVEDLTEEMREILKPPVEGYETSGVTPPLWAMLLHNPGVLSVFKPMAWHFLAGSALSARDRELVILRVAWVRQIPYVWGEHAQIGQTVGVSAEEVAKVMEGSSAEGWSEHDRALVTAAEEVCAELMISDATWATLAKTLDEGQLVELPVLIGMYQMLGGLMNSVRLPLRPGNEGLSAR
jgi:alkylhydroperoxidase family enzyme